ncbi:MAG: TonB-dependent receptor plug domain-containing protein [Woeseia sp.]
MPSGKRTYRQGLIVTTVLLSAIPMAESVAQQAEAIEEIQVTATRRPLASSKVSAAVTVVGSRDIAMQKLATDALASQLGVFLQQTTVGQGAPIIRGMKGSEVLHLVDGLRLNNAIFRNAPTQYLALVAPGSIERMEVVRGSPTSLYGSDAVGGVIQVISRLPTFESDGMEWRREFSAAADTAEQSRSARLTVDGGTRQAAGLVSVAWQEAGNRRIGGGERIAPSGFESYSLRGALQLRPAEDRSWVFDAQFTRQPETPRVDEMVPGFGQTEPSSAEFYFEPNARHFVHLRHTRDNGLWSSDWTIDLGWQRIDDDRRTRDFGADQRRFEENSSDLFGLSVNATREAGSASWVYGAEVYHDEVRSSREERNINTDEVTLLQSRFPDGAEVAQAAVFANVSQEAGTRHTLSGGLRFSHVGIDLPATTNSADQLSVCRRRPMSYCNTRSDSSAGLGILKRLPGLSPSVPRSKTLGARKP